MKPVKFLFICSLITVLAVSCEKGLDPITPVKPGDDLLPPEVVVNYPEEGKIVRLSDTIGTIIFKLVATDDIELKSVTVQLDGTEIGSVTSFKDYRRAVVALEYNSLTDGDHTLTVTVFDLTDKSITKSVDFKKITAPVYNPLAQEVLYLSFDGSYLDLISGNELTVDGAPGFATGKVGDAYAGAEDAYLEYPTDGIVGSEFSLAFWYKLNSTPDRSGIVSISPPGESRNSGIRLAREKSGTNQNLFINYGTGTAEVWINPFYQVVPSDEWMHIAITVTSSKVTFFVNDSIVKEQDVTAAIAWTDCPSISIGSGMPNFVYWEHFSDLSLYDEMHFFTRAITADEVHSLYAVK